jgi:hypothetical protein
MIPPDFLLTGFRSFTQDADGRPSPNPTESLLRMICDGPVRAAGAPTDLWLGRAQLAGLRCLLAVADVNYQAPSHIVELIRAARPRAVVCLGLGGETVIETGATNRVKKDRPTYDRHGLPLRGEYPPSTVLDPAFPEGAGITLPWGDQNLARLREVAARWGDSSPLGPVAVAPAARPGNDYVCNATAWAVAKVKSTNAGFLHVAPPPVPSDGYFLAAANLLVDVVRAIRPE